MVVRVPANWHMNRPPCPKVSASVGGEEPSFVGAEALLDFHVQVTLGDETLSENGIREILQGADGLALVRGKWVEIDRERLQKTLAQFEAIERRAEAEGLTFAEAMRLLAGASVGDGADETARGGWGEIAAGPWFAETLKAMRQPEGRTCADPGEALRGTLRPYQRAGVEWLHLLTQLRLGACLADDMGLGKTIQLLSLLLVLKREAQKPAKGKKSKVEGELSGPKPPDSARLALGKLVGRDRQICARTESVGGSPIRDAGRRSQGAFQQQFDGRGSGHHHLRFGPPPAMAGRDLLAPRDSGRGAGDQEPRSQTDQGHQAPQGALADRSDRDSHRKPAGRAVVAVRLHNLSLLGTAKQFTQFVKRLEDRPHNPHGPLRDLVRPYILRRLKTDKSIIADLPDKTEVKAYCSLSRKQAALYQQAVADLAERLETADNIERRGVILAALMRFKQICNHPSQWLGDGDWAEEDSGNWLVCAISPRLSPRARRKSWFLLNSKRPRGR